MLDRQEPEVPKPEQESMLETVIRSAASGVYGITAIGAAALGGLILYKLGTNIYDAVQNSKEVFNAGNYTMGGIAVGSFILSGVLAAYARHLYKSIDREKEEESQLAKQIERIKKRK